MTVRGPALALLGVLPVMACSRASSPGVVEASTEAPQTSATASVRSPVDAPAAPAHEDLAPPGAAKRTTLAALERAPLLRPQLARLRQHFGGDGGQDARGPFLMQTVQLATGRDGVLVSRADERDPIVLALDRDQLVFAKDHPLAGIAPPVVHATLAPAPERGLAVFAYVESMHILAARMWADDANPYADLEVFHPDACDMLAVGYEAGVGWIVACTSKAGTRAQRLRDDLTSGWGREGIAVGTAGPVTQSEIGFDGPAVWTLTQRARAVGGDRTLTFRYDVAGQPL